jgi:Terminase large subunit, ATPase domain
MRRKRPGPGSFSPDDPVTEWAKAVTTGTVVAGPYVRAACERHLRDLEQGSSRGLKWDRAAVHRVLRFFAEGLALAGGQFEGRPFVLQPSQAFIVGSIFGWKRPDGRRRFRRAYIEEGKGSGKSPLAAGIGMYCLTSDSEPRAEVYAAGSMKSQAMVLFRDAVAMWQQSEDLRNRLTPSGGNPIWNLTDLQTGSFFRPKATGFASISSRSSTPLGSRCPSSSTRRAASARPPRVACGCRARS